MKQGKDLDSRVLRQVGAERTLVNARIERVRTTRSVWVLPEEFQPPQRDEENQPGEPGELDD